MGKDRQWPFGFSSVWEPLYAIVFHGRSLAVLLYIGDERLLLWPNDTMIYPIAHARAAGAGAEEGGEEALWRRQSFVRGNRQERALFVLAGSVWALVRHAMRFSALGLSENE